ncbi:helix-turn-helix domain-containing protein [Solirhodobacter olei]|uniref:helix-turn-helix domain-containing protein n=1 Tax=Solirhodobacter olei TaxID=2493082 RepID=UPI000FD90D21|nr:helix-turn-helix domain-containing protein [Solirhodobacter olei]
MTIQSSREFAALARTAKVGNDGHRVGPSPVNAVIHYDIGALIFSQGDRAGNIFTVTSGAVRLSHLLADGRRQVLAFCMPGEVFGFAQDGIYSFFAEAIEDCSVVAHSPQEVRAADNLNAALSSLFSAQSHMLVLGRQCAAERLASFLLDMAKRQRGRRCVELSMSRADIADYLGLTVETVSRGLGKLQKDGVILLHSARCIEIREPQVLRDMVE